MKKQKQIQVRLDKPLFDELKEHAAFTHISVSEFVRMAIRSTFDEKDAFKDFERRLNIIESRLDITLFSEAPE